MYTDEFRIGNFILDRNKEVEIIGILRGGFYFENTDLKLQLNVGDRFSPIPLTEEWLTKFGFDSEGFRQYDWLNYGMFAVKGLSDDYVLFQGFFKKDSELTSVKYVHQLQNLYFALTGVELTLSST